MHGNTNGALVVALVVILGLFVLFGSGAMTGGRVGGGMMGTAWMGGFGWMWIPAVLIVGLGVCCLRGAWPGRRRDQPTHEDGRSRLMS